MGSVRRLRVSQVCEFGAASEVVNEAVAGRGAAAVRAVSNAILRAALVAEAIAAAALQLVAASAFNDSVAATLAPPNLQTCTICTRG